MYFLKTNNIYGYIVTPVVTEVLYNHHFSSCPLTAILNHTLQHILHCNHISYMYAQTFFPNSLLTNDVPTYVQSYIHITYLSVISWIPNSFTIYLSQLSLHVQTVSFTSRNSICTDVLTRFFTFYFLKGLKQIYLSTHYYVSQYRTFFNK